MSLTSQPPPAGVVDRAGAVAQTPPMTEHGMSWTVEARNTAPDSENKIHDDEVARQHGFAGGLVPGVTTYAWLARQALVALGPEWLRRGSLEARFVKPVYEGDHITIEATPAVPEDRPESAAATHDAPVTITAYRPDGEVAAVGTATLPATANVPPDLDAFPRAELPERPPPVSAEVLRGLGPLGVLGAGFHDDRAHEYLTSVGDDHPHWEVDDVAHPGWLMLFANWILAANVQLGPWIHTGSTVTHYRTVRDGEHVEVRGRVADVYERKRHELVDLELLYVVEEEPVQHVHHTAIYRLRSG